jgi:hypothetical protein
MSKIMFSPDIDDVQSLQSDETVKDFQQALKKVGLNVDRVRYNKKTLTPSWYRNKKIKHYSFDIGDKLLHFYVNKDGMLMRLTLDKVFVENNPKAGVSKSISRVAKDIFHAYQQVEALSDKGNATLEGDMAEISDSELKKMLSKSNISTDDELAKEYEERLKNLTAGSGMFVVATKDNRYLEEKRSDEKEEFSTDTLKIRFFDDEVAATTVMNELDEAYQVYKV